MFEYQVFTVKTDRVVVYASCSRFSYVRNDKKNTNKIKHIHSPHRNNINSYNIKLFFKWNFDEWKQKKTITYVRFESRSVAFVLDRFFFCCYFVIQSEYFLFGCLFLDCVCRILFCRDLFVLKECHCLHCIKPSFRLRFEFQVNKIRWKGETKSLHEIWISYNVTGCCVAPPSSITIW